MAGLGGVSGLGVCYGDAADAASLARVRIVGARHRRAHRRVGCERECSGGLCAFTSDTCDALRRVACPTGGRRAGLLLNSHIVALSKQHSEAASVASACDVGHAAAGSATRGSLGRWCSRTCRHSAHAVARGNSHGGRRCRLASRATAAGVCGGLGRRPRSAAVVKQSRQAGRVRGVFHSACSAVAMPDAICERFACELKAAWVCVVYRRSMATRAWLAGLWVTRAGSSSSKL